MYAFQQIKDLFLNYLDLFFKKYMYICETKVRTKMPFNVFTEDHPSAGMQGQCKSLDHLGPNMQPTISSDRKS